MTTAIIHGDPGSRKTATLVGEYGVPALYAGRTVVTNIRGFNDKRKIEEAYGKPLPEGAELIALPFTREGFRKMGTFFHWAPVGALILMDEGQRVYPTRLRDLKMYDCNPPRETGFVDKATGQPEDISTVEEAFDCHRHMNWDIYISTPNIAKIHKEIRQVAEWGYRQKDLASIHPLFAMILGDFKRVKHNAENSGTAENASLGASNHRVKAKVFRCYQSTATGVAKETHTKTSLLSQPKLLCLLLLVGWCIWRFGSSLWTYGTIFPTADQMLKEEQRKQDSQVVTSSAQMVRTSSTPAAAGLPSGDEFYGNGHSGAALEIFSAIHSYHGYVASGDGSMEYFLTLRIGDDYLPISSRDLKGMGFYVYPREGFLIVQHGDYAKVVHNRRRPLQRYEPEQEPTEPALSQYNPFKSG